MRRITATEARVHLGETLERIENDQEPRQVESGGEPSIVILPAAEFERLSDPDHWGLFWRLQRTLAEQIRNRRGADLNLDDLDEMIEIGRR